MKLKEKLASEYVMGPECEVMDTIKAHEESYLAGFEKAREMAIQECKLTSRNPLIERIENLGEEEME